MSSGRSRVSNTRSCAHHDLQQPWIVRVALVNGVCPEQTQIARELAQVAVRHEAWRRASLQPSRLREHFRRCRHAVDLQTDGCLHLPGKIDGAWAIHVLFAADDDQIDLGMRHPAGFDDILDGRFLGQGAANRVATPAPLAPQKGSEIAGKGEFDREHSKPIYDAGRQQNIPAVCTHASRGRPPADVQLAPFRNPLLPAPSQDPWVMVHEGVFHALNTDGRRIFLRRSSDVLNSFRAACRHGLEGTGARPQLQAPLGTRAAPARAAGSSTTRRTTAATATIACGHSKRRRRSRRPLPERRHDPDRRLVHRRHGAAWLGRKRFLLWSGWEGAAKGAQNLYIAPLADPVTLAAPRVLLTQPTEPWEQRGGSICEGPAVLQRGG